MSSPVVLITGALTGIGRATAVAFAREGARVVVSGRHDDEGRKLATELRKPSSRSRRSHQTRQQERLRVSFPNYHSMY